MVTMSEEITELQKKILSVIIADSRRPGAITSILKRKMECNQNDVMQALLDLEKRKLVERSSSKAWSATGDAEDYID